MRTRLGQTRQWWIAAVPLALALSNCGSGDNPVDPGDDPEGLRVLFVGNSLTYYNDMPAMLAAMLQTAGVAVGRIEDISFPNYGLQDHWVSGPSRQRIAEGAFDVVVMQQGPSATEGRPSLLDYSQRFAGEIELAGGRPALYMVWPSVQRSFDFDGVSDSYATAAATVGGLLFPAGEAWRASWRRDENLELYGRDGFHPSVLGSYLAALVMFEQLANMDPHLLPARIQTNTGVMDLSSELATLLQDAAVEANAQFALATAR